MKNTHSYERNGIVYVKGTINGKRYRLSTGKKASKKMLDYVHRNWQSEIQRICLEGEERLARIIIAKQEQKAQISFKDFCSAHLLPIWESTLKASTLLSRVATLNNVLYPAFGDKPLSTLHYTTLAEWLFNYKTKKGQKMSAGYFSAIYGILRAIFEEAKKSEIITENPLKGLKKPKQQPSSDAPFSYDEIAKILRCSDAFIRDFASIAFFTGMRTGELLGLCWDCIDFTNDTIHVEQNATLGGLTTPKTGRRTIDMLPCVRAKLQELHSQRTTQWVFPKKNGQNYSASKSILRRWKKALLECNIPYRSIYHTRHTFATTMISAGEDILWVSATLGHANTQMTFERYAKFIPKTRPQRASNVETAIAGLMENGNA